jgi:hypothetical protein
MITYISYVPFVESDTPYIMNTRGGVVTNACRIDSSYIYIYILSIYAKKYYQLVLEFRFCKKKGLEFRKALLRPG